VVNSLIYDDDLVIGWFGLSCSHNVSCRFLANALSGLGVVRHATSSNGAVRVVVVFNYGRLGDVIDVLLNRLFGICSIDLCELLNVRDLKQYRVIEEGIYTGLKNIGTLNMDLGTVTLMGKVSKASDLNVLIRIMLNKEVLIKIVKDIYGYDPSKLLEGVKLRGFRFLMNFKNSMFKFTVRCKDTKECRETLRYVNLVNCVDCSNPICGNYFEIKVEKKT